MSTKQKRIFVTLTPELERALYRLSRVMGIPVATAARMFLVEAVPMLDELSDIFETGQLTDVRERFVHLARRLEGQISELPYQGPDEGD